MSEGVYSVVWPRGRRLAERATLAPRLGTLDGKTIGLLWDYVFRGDEIFPIVERELGRRFPGIRFVRWDDFGAIYGGDEHRTIAALPERLQRHGVDAVVSAVGC
ncbi:MAG: hypothetical protein HYU41_27385 [Candidatus Rokubacteria bacterium]|nr:hypothetical protein [Candidatus Rokubacteria bacterium]